MRNGVLAVGLIAAMAGSASAETAAGWDLNVSSYLWAAGLEADTEQFGLPKTHVELSFGDIIEDLDGAIMVTVGARRDGVLLWADLIYTNVSANDATPYGVVANSVYSRTKSFTGTFGAGYELISTDQTRLDLVGGLRIWSIDSKLGFSGGLLDGRQAKDSATWLDAVAGIRGTHQLSGNYYVDGWLLMGGGGADKDWDIAAMVGYRFNERFSAVAGWRALGVDYSHGGFSYDAIQRGPILGAVFKF